MSLGSIQCAESCECISAIEVDLKLESFLLGDFQYAKNWPQMLFTSDHDVNELPLFIMAML